MQVIPVIDLKDGCAVHARRGERAAYAPIVSQLCEGADPVALVRGYLGLFPFPTVYVADLNAIQGEAPDLASIEAILAAAPGLELWVDCGLADARSAGTFLDSCRATAVLGSESLTGAGALDELAGRHERLVLSLDFRGDAPLGPADVWQKVDSWPPRLVVMTLSRVGSGLGPDLTRLRQVQGQAGRRAIFAAGGVRSAADLDELARQGIAGALIATALHDGRLDRRDLERLAE